MKKPKQVVFILLLALITMGIYWYVIHPHTYKYDTAVSNGDVVMGPSGAVNVEKLHDFIKKVENKQPDKIRITAYSKEGYPTIYDLNFDGEIIKCVTDNTRDLYGRAIFKDYGEYTKVLKNELNDYILIDKTGKYKDKWIFQE